VITPATEGGADRLMTASEIAELGGVGPSAVSNWRKRFADFPSPVGTAPGGGDLFRLADIERWLHARGKTKRSARSVGDQLWSIAERLRGRPLAGDVAGVVAVAAGFVHLARQLDGLPLHELLVAPDDVAPLVRDTTRRLEQERPELARFFDPLDDLDAQTLRLLLDTLNDFASSEQLSAAVDAVLARGSRYSEFRTPPGAADLLVELADPHENFFDPAVGSAEFLVRAAAANPQVRLFAQELNVDTWRIAVARLLLRDLHANIALGDSLNEDAFPTLRADVVGTEPPAGGRAQVSSRPGDDPRWGLLGLLDSPPPRAADFTWLAHVIHHLRDDGRGYVLLPVGSLFRGGVEARLRSELLRQGMIEAIVALPTGALQNTMAGSALWIVRRPAHAPDDVLLVAGNAGDGRLDQEQRERIIAAVRTWRTRRHEFEPIAGFATNVPVLDLLAGDAALLPNRWLYEPELVNSDAVLHAFLDAQRDLENARKQVALAPTQPDLRPMSEPPQRLRVRDLVEHRLARIIRPSRLKTDDLTDEGGVPVWLPGDVRVPWERREPQKFADPALVDPRSITQPGDIVFTTIGGIRTRVDFEGGHALGTSLQALRLDPNAFEPRAVAAFLTSEPNRQLLAGVVPRVNVLELEIPRLPLDEARKFADALEALERYEEEGVTLARRAEAVRESLIAALATGAATISDGLKTAND
jgi:N-6 DNA Methylase